MGKNLAQEAPVGKLNNNMGFYRENTFISHRPTQTHTDILSCRHGRAKTVRA